MQHVQQKGTGIIMIKGNTVLLLVDVQQGLMDSTLHWYSQKNVDTVKRIKKLLDACREKAIPAIFVKEVHRSTMLDFGRELDGNEKVHCVDGNPNTEVAEYLGVGSDDIVIPKRRYSAFLYTDLEIVLSGLGIHPGDTIIMCGFLTDVCVHYTFVDAHQRDYRIKVIEDCCGGSSKEAHDYAFSAMKYLQKDAPVDLNEIIADIGKYKKAE